MQFRVHSITQTRYIIMMRYSYVKQDLAMCRVQEQQLSLYFLSYLPLMVKATMHSILNIVRNISMRLYGSVEEVVTKCHDKKYGGSRVHTPPPS